MINLNSLKEHVSTQYGDLTGVIQIDGHSNITSIYELSSDHGFVTTDVFIIGVGFTEFTTNGIGRKNEVSCSIFYVNKSAYGSSFDEIEKKIKSGSGHLKLKRKNIDVKYSDLGKYIKRYDFVALTDLAGAAKSIEIEENEDDYDDED